MPKLSAIGSYNFDLYGTPLNGRKWAFPELQNVRAWCFEKPISCSFFLPKLKKADTGDFGIGSQRKKCVSNKFFLGPEPPVFEDYNSEFSGTNCSVIVPTGAAAAYQANDEWAACIALNGHKLIEVDDLSAAWQQEVAG